MTCRLSLSSTGVGGRVSDASINGMALLGLDIKKRRLHNQRMEGNLCRTPAHPVKYGTYFSGFWLLVAYKNNLTQVKGHPAIKVTCLVFHATICCRSISLHSPQSGSLGCREVDLAHMWTNSICDSKWIWKDTHFGLDQSGSATGIDSIYYTYIQEFEMILSWDGASPVRRR
jgi:hypothetical protein